MYPTDQDNVTPIQDLHGEIRQRFGLVPSFFSSAAESPEVMQILWGKALAGYLDNSLPSLFKEKLFTYLSRFCNTPYCLARHSAFLMGWGRVAGDAACSPLSPEQVLDLVKRPLPTADAFAAQLRFLASTRGPLDGWPDEGSLLENALFDCSIPLFLRNENMETFQTELRRLLGSAGYDQLILLLAFIHTAHYWTETHPAITVEDDVRHLLAEHKKLAEWIEAFPDQVEKERLRRSREELDTLRLLYVDLKEHVAAQSQRNRFLARVFTDSANAIFIKDLDGHVTDMNRAAEKLYGWTRAKLIGKSIKLIVPPSEHREREELMARCAQGEKVHGVEGLRLKKNGEAVPVLLTFSQLTDDEGRLVGFAVISEDISLIKAAEADLRRLSSELVLAEERERKRIASELHDELGQMLALCQGEVERLSLEKMSNQGLRQVKRLRELLEKAAAETRELTYELSSPLLHTLGLEPAVEQVCADFNQHYPSQFLFHDDGEAKDLSEGTQIVFFRCVRELLMNVTKHARSSEAHCLLSRRGDYVRAEITDNGVGFEAEDAGQGFSPGGGFGLFNMNEYVRHVGGSLELESLPGAGTRAVLEVPLQDLGRDRASGGAWDGPNDQNHTC